jgi:glycyl-tRNA synthetase
LDSSDYEKVIGPDVKTAGTLTEPRQFNMMFHSYAGAAAGEENKVYLRPETCAGIFLNFKNVLDSSRVRVPFGIAQIGKAFRNEVTPRNFIFRSREFEQMELEWFCHPDDVPMWFDFWVEQRKKFWDKIGIDLNKIHFLDVPKEELAHYSKGTIDFEYQFPFSGDGYDELEGVAHRGNFDLTAHQEHSGTKLQYIDPITNDRYLPDVIEPSCGLTRGVLALLSEAYTVDENRPSGVYMNFHPSMAPKKAAILPLVAKDGMPEAATKLYMELREHFAVDLDIKQNIGKRYARQDEIGTPYCFTIDGDTLTDGTVTVRERNTMAQERIPMDSVLAYLKERI